MKVEELIRITNEIDDIFHKYNFIVDHYILSRHVFNIIRESYPNDSIELENPDLKHLLRLKILPEIV